MTRNQKLGLAGISLAGLALVGLALAGLAQVGAMWFVPRKSSGAAVPTKSGYVDSTVCAGCHQDVFRTYRLTGMGRSLYRLSAENAVEDFRSNNRIYNQASDRYYTMFERDGKWFQRRHQVGFGGKETNVVEKQIDYVIGSGNHVRSYLSRMPDGRMIELPVSWYAEKGGYWAMSPGYDRADQKDFRRTVVTECISCHNRYLPPEQVSHADESVPVFSERIGEGIDCQRCHGPGRAHAEAAGSGRATPAAIRQAIVNPARLPRDRQLEVCMQCHLETTSGSLPHSIPKYDREPFTWNPGEPLSDAFLFFDRAAGAQDGFEIAHAAYRLRQSRCFLSSDMTCTTCHNPHSALRGEEAVQHYTSVCLTCHSAAHAANPPAQGSCIDCHMPKRRTDDAVHVVMTDHYIQRRKPARDLLAPLRETTPAAEGYRGEVALYYPPQLPQTPENALYLDVAQVHDGSNLKSGIARLQLDLQKFAPAAPEFYLELGEAYAKTGNREEAIRWYEEALRHRADFRPALVELGSELAAGEQLQRAAEVLEKAAGLPPADAVVLVNLGGVWLRQGNIEKAEQYLRQAMTVNPDTPEGHNLLGLLLGQKGDWTGAEKELREAISIQPDLAEPHFNLARVLAGHRSFEEARYHFEKAIAIQPAYAEAHHNYGLLLAAMNFPDKAMVEYRIALRLQSGQAETHSDLADLLAARGRASDAADEYRQALQRDPQFHAAHLGLGLILARQGRAAEAREHLQQAALSPDPDIRDTAVKALR